MSNDYRPENFTEEVLRKMHQDAIAHLPKKGERMKYEPHQWYCTHKPKAEDFYHPNVVGVKKAKLIISTGL